MLKLTLVSITYRGVRHSVFVKLHYEQGRAVVDYEKIAALLGIPQGCTYTIS